MLGASMPYLKTSDLEIYYEISGEGEPVILIGGLTSTVLSWQYQQKELEKYYKIILFDNRGSGRTKILTPYKLTMELFAQDVYNLLQGLGLKKAHIVGASMGGMIAQVFAYSYPELCLSLTLCCTHAGFEKAVKADQEVVKIMLNRQGLSEEEGERRALQAVAHPSSFEKRKEIIEFYLQSKLAFPHSAEELSRRGEAINAFDYWNKLPEIKIPTLVMSGAEDRLIPAANAQIMAECIPNSELILIKNSAHLFFIEEFEEFNKSLLNFLGRHSAVDKG